MYTEIDTETGKEKLSKPTGLSPAFYFCRPVYANGMSLCRGK